MYQQVFGHICNETASRLECKTGWRLSYAGKSSVPGIATPYLKSVLLAFGMWSLPMYMLHNGYVIQHEHIAQIKKITYLHIQFLRHPYS